MMPRGTPHYGPSYGHEAAPNGGLPYPPAPYMIYPHQTMQYPYPPATNLTMPGPPHMIYPGSMKYPSQSQATVPPVPPRKSLKKPPPPPATVDKKVVKTNDVLDGTSGATGLLDEVLKPLPAPLEPEKLPSAKMAAVNAVNKTDGRLHLK